jgi:hypothetical protein
MNQLIPSFKQAPNLGLETGTEFKAPHGKPHVAINHQLFTIHYLPTQHLIIFSRVTPANFSEIIIISQHPQRSREIRANQQIIATRWWEGPPPGSFTLPYKFTDLSKAW